MTLEVSFGEIQTFAYDGDLCIWDLDKGPPPQGVAITDLVTHRVEGIWDVTTAKGIIEGRPPDCMIFPAELASIHKNVTIDHDHAMATDLSDPAIAIVIQLDEMEDWFIIDGWHRIHKAIELGIEEIPCCRLSKEETKSVTLSWKVTPL